MPGKLEFGWVRVVMALHEQRMGYVSLLNDDQMSKWLEVEHQLGVFCVLCFLFDCRIRSGNREMCFFRICFFTLGVLPNSFAGPLQVFLASFWIRKVHFVDGSAFSLYGRPSSDPSVPLEKAASGARSCGSSWGCGLIQPYGLLLGGWAPI